MDGTEPTPIVRNLGNACGLTIDFHHSRLYWADDSAKKIQSSNLAGADIVTVAQISSYPYGIVVVRQRLHWSLINAKALQSNSDGVNKLTII